MIFMFGSRLGCPPPCPVDDSPHTTCTSSGPIVVQQLPARDALAEAVRVPELRAEQIQKTLGPTEFTTATYKSPKARRR